MQTLNGIAAEHNSTIVFPVPIDILSNFMSCSQQAPAAAAPGSSANIICKDLLSSVLVPPLMSDSVRKPISFIHILQ